MRQSCRVRKNLKKTFAKKRNQRRAIYLGSALIITGLTSSLVATQTHAAYKTHNYEQKIQVQTKHINTYQHTLEQTKQTLQQVQQEKDAKAKQVEQLNAQLQARGEQKSSDIALVSAVEPVTPPSGPIDGCGDNEFAHYIYMKESGCQLRNPNSSGCDGIGQACPASKLLAVCPNMDYTCQNSFFTSYADKYGGWAGAYSAWLSQGWW